MFNICTQYFMKLTSFKNMGYFFTGILFLAVFLVSSSKPYDLTEAVITLNNLSSRNHLSIEKDFNKMRGVDFCDVSLITNSITLQINDGIISISDIENTLRKWGCIPIKYNFVKIASILSN